jgi:hypothetical protein
VTWHWLNYGSWLVTEFIGHRFLLSTNDYTVYKHSKWFSLLYHSSLVPCWPCHHRHVRLWALKSQTLLNVFCHCWPQQWLWQANLHRCFVDHLGDTNSNNSKSVGHIFVAVDTGFNKMLASNGCLCDIYMIQRFWSFLFLTTMSQYVSSIFLTIFCLLAFVKGESRLRTSCHLWFYLCSTILMTDQLTNFLEI